MSLIIFMAGVILGIAITQVVLMYRLHQLHFQDLEIDNFWYNNKFRYDWATGMRIIVEDDEKVEK